MTDFIQYDGYQIWENMGGGFDIYQFPDPEPIETGLATEQFAKDVIDTWRSSIR